MTFPFTLSSDFDLGARSGAMVVSGGGDVMVGEGEVPTSIESEFDGAAFQLRRGEFLLNVPDGTRIYVRDGTKITYQRGPKTSDRDLSLFILGSALGALVYQRGLLPIHASAVISDGKIMAFTGLSGAGKSTLAANLSQRGYPFFTDDTLIFDPGRTVGGAICFPGQKRLKLWRDAIEMTGAEAIHRVRDHNEIDKHFAVPPNESDLASAPLAKLFVVRRARSNAKSDNVLEKVTGIDALQAIRSNLYRPQYSEILMGRKALFSALKILAENVQVARFVRRMGPENYETALDIVETEIGAAKASVL